MICIVMIRGDIMASRMDKYHSDNASSIQSRSTKNEHLYQKLYTNKVYTEFSNNEPNNIVDLSNLKTEKNLNRREQFQKNKLLNGNENNVTYNHNLDYHSEILENKTEKNYDINNILENARKNRREDDELEKKRRLKNVEYSILSDLSQDKLKEYRENKKLTKDEEENLEELIHTITSNSLRKKIDDELLSDLLPSEESEATTPEQLSSVIDDEMIDNSSIDNDSDSAEEEKNIDKSFYTRSLDLSEEDFEFSEEEEEEDRSFLEDKKMGILPKILITILILAILCVISYIVYYFILR